MSADLFGHPITSGSRYSWSVTCSSATITGEGQTLEAAQMSAQEVHSVHGGHAIISGPNGRLFEFVHPHGNPQHVWMLK